MRSYTNLRGAFRATGASLPFYPEGRTYSPPAKQAVVSLPLVGLVRSSRTVHRTLLQRGQEMPQVSIPCAVGASADAEIAACRTNPADTLPASCLRKPATGSFIADMGSNAAHFSCKEKQKPRGGVLPPPHKIRIEVNANGNLPLGGKGGQPGSRTLRLCSLRLSQLLPHPQ